MARKALAWKPTDHGNIKGGGEEAAFTLVLTSSKDTYLTSLNLSFSNHFIFHLTFIKIPCTTFT